MVRSTSGGGAVEWTWPPPALTHDHPTVPLLLLAVDPNPTVAPSHLLPLLVGQKRPRVARNSGGAMAGAAVLGEGVLVVLVGTGLAGATSPIFLPAGQIHPAGKKN